MGQDPVDKPKNHRILLAEDNEDDYLLIRDAFEETGLPVEIRWVRDGEELLDYLLRRDDYAKPGSAPIPGLILLDMKMPRKNGLEALKDIKAHPRLRLIPVVALSTSSAEEDIRAAYDLGINAYVKKPVGFVLFLEAMEAVYNFWFKLAKRAVEET